MLRFRTWGSVLVLSLLATMIGCNSYEKQRPPVDQLDPRDRGIQSKDVVDASQEMATQLMRLSEMNQPTRQTVVVTNVTNQTTNPYMNYDIFIQRLRGIIGQQAHDRIMLIGRKTNVEQLRGQELEGRPDEFGQGGGRAGVPRQRPTGVGAAGHDQRIGQARQPATITSISASRTCGRARAFRWCLK